MSEKRSAALGFIFLTVLIDCIGIGIIIPVIPDLIRQLTGEGLSEASETGGWLLVAYSSMQFVFSPILGGLSDRYGRRPILLISLLGLGVDYLFLTFAPDLFWLFVGRFIAGICGASFTTASAYIADISSHEKRAQNFGLIGAAFGLGFIIGPVIAGLTSHLGVRAPFMIAAGLSFLNFLYGLIILPESLPREQRRAFDWRRANPIGSVLHLKRYPKILSLIISVMLIYIAGHAAQSTWTYYTMLKFNWSVRWVSYSLAFVGLSIAVVQGGLIRVIIPKIGQKNAVYFGLGLYIVGFLLFAFATEGWMMFAFMIPYALAGISGPAMQGIMSSQVSPSEQGELQGTLTSLISLTSIFGPLLMTMLFYHFTQKNAVIYFPGAPFAAGAVLTVISLVLAIRSFAIHHKEPNRL